VGEVFWVIVFAGMLTGVVSIVVGICVFGAPHGSAKGVALIYGFPAYAPFVAFYSILRYTQIAAVKKAVKKVLGFDPRKQNRAAGVIYHFYELRMTRTELIKGYGTGAPRIPLRGLTATVRDAGTSTGRVDITIKGPDTKLVYSMTDSVLRGTTRNARQFANLLNYEASLLGAPPKKCRRSRRLRQVPRRPTRLPQR
jgi:hypothetical protein